MATAKSMNILVARTSARFSFDGRSVTIRKGTTTVREGHPILRGREHLFEPFTITYDVPIEAARPKSKST